MPTDREVLIKRRFAVLVAFAATLSCAYPGVAFALQYYVDGAVGDDTNTCLQPADGPPPLGPCDTIDHALDLAQANPGADEVIVADGTYPEAVQVLAGTTLRTLDSSDPKPVINNTPAAPTTPAVEISGSGTVNGFEIRSDYLPLRVSGAAIVAANDFPTTTPSAFPADVLSNSASGAVAISGNDFTDDGLGDQSGIQAMATASTNLTVQGNSFSGLQQAIGLISGGGPATIADNQITGAHENNGTGILVYQGAPVIRNNTISAAGTGTPSGISLSDTNGPTGASMSRNTITGVTNGLVVTDTSLPVTLSGDVIAGNGFHGVQNSDFGQGADITATNVTAFDNVDADFYLQDTHLTLDSSIVDDVARIGTATCTISFSRGFAVGGPPADNCDDFQSNSNPLFVSPGSPDFDYHLQAGSPMIDAGNPLAPGAGVLDLDGDARALSAAPACPARRDIGADEFVPASPGPAVCPADATPLAPATKKKCKKGRKLKKGKCVKKKRGKRR